MRNPFKRTPKPPEESTVPPVEKMSLEEILLQTSVALYNLNNLSRSLPRGYRLYVDFDSRPIKVHLIKGAWENAHPIEEEVLRANGQDV